MKASPLVRMIADAGFDTDMAVMKAAKVNLGFFYGVKKGVFNPDNPQVDRLASTLKVEPDAIRSLARHKAAKRQHAAATKKTRNKIKRRPVEVRQSVRGLAEAVNLAILRQERYLEAIPVEAIRDVLQELFDRTNVKGNVLLDPKFATLFK